MLFLRRARSSGGGADILAGGSDLMGMAIQSIRLEKTDVLAILSAYRAARCLAAGQAVRVRVCAAKPGYEHAMDPDLIRPQRVFPLLPIDGGSRDPGSRWVAFTRRVERRVQRLEPLERAVIQTQYMGSFALSDAEAVRMLSRAGVRLDLAAFRAQKHAGLARLAVLFRSL